MAEIKYDQNIFLSSVNIMMLKKFQKVASKMIKFKVYQVQFPLDPTMWLFCHSNAKLLNEFSPFNDTVLVHYIQSNWTQYSLSLLSK